MKSEAAGLGRQKITRAIYGEMTGALVARSINVLFSIDAIPVPLLRSAASAIRVLVMRVTLVPLGMIIELSALGSGVMAAEK